MKQIKVLALLALVSAMLLPVAVGVNTLSVNSQPIWADGSGMPIPPLPPTKPVHGFLDGSGMPIPPLPPTGPKG
ncbi:MAG: hypothetical protein WCA98_15485 [Candidatus Acidiferrales bacterium]